MTPRRSANAFERQVEAVLDAGACPLNPPPWSTSVMATPWWYARAAATPPRLGL
jgi:hypothetical protein